MHEELCLSVHLDVCVVTQSPRFVLARPQATWVLVLSKKCMLLFQLVLWKDTHTAISHTVTVWVQMWQKSDTLLTFLSQPSRAVYSCVLIFFVVVWLDVAWGESCVHLVMQNTFQRN